MSFGERLREERKRIRLNQTDFGKVGGVSKRSQISYENGETSPGAEYWEAVAKIGADVQYILTGIRSGNLDDVIDAVAEVAQKEKEQSTEAGALSPRDRIWLKIGQGLSDEDRTRLQAIGITLVSARELIDKAKDK